MTQQKASEVPLKNKTKTHEQFQEQLIESINYNTELMLKKKNKNWSPDNDDETELMNAYELAEEFGLNGSWFEEVLSGQETLTIKDIFDIEEMLAIQLIYVTPLTKLE